MDDVAEVDLAACLALFSIYHPEHRFTFIRYAAGGGLADFPSRRCARVTEANLVVRHKAVLKLTINVAITGSYGGGDFPCEASSNFGAFHTNGRNRHCEITASSTGSATDTAPSVITLASDLAIVNGRRLRALATRVKVQYVYNYFPM